MGSIVGVMKIAAGKIGISHEEYLRLIADGFKWCSRSKHWQVRELFDKDISRTDGLSAKCIPCTRVLVRVNRKGRPSPHRGKRHSEETRRLWSALKKGKPGLATGPRSAQACRNISEGRKRAAAVQRANRLNWDGGFKKNNQELRSDYRYAPWRWAVFERDNFTCQDCGDGSGGNLQAHHLKEFAKHPELRFEVSNGLTLCRACHRKRHFKPNSLRNLAKMRRPEGVLS